VISDEMIIIAADSAERMSRSSARWGLLAVGHSAFREVFNIVGISDGAGDMFIDPAQGHVRVTFPGTWCRVTPALQDAHEWLFRIGHSLPRPLFCAMLAIAPELVADEKTILVTYCPDGGPDRVGWLLTGDQAVPLDLDVLRPATADPLPLLEPGWPLRDLTGEIAVVGVGSIGSATALALAMYGVHRISLVDDDRLRWHNLVRHQTTRHAVGQYKVEAISQAIRQRWPATEVVPLRLNVISDANLMRPLFRRCALIVCAADGVAPRRVVSHLARRASKTAILACVLMDGAFGEIIRLRPWPGWGCLLCQRAYLASTGAMDPEPTLDSGYGTGTMHRPMTAVGSDLALVGQYAAKVAVATLLEYAGHYDQCIEQDWAVIGLRSDLRAPDPFRLSPGEVRWLPHAASLPSCPTCGAAE
jgi:molybdopterin/thiamine biosynthesis adenylyltransferase